MFHNEKEIAPLVRDHECFWVLCIYYLLRHVTILIDFSSTECCLCQIILLLHEKMKPVSLDSPDIQHPPPPSISPEELTLALCLKPRTNHYLIMLPS